MLLLHGERLIFFLYFFFLSPLLYGNIGQWPYNRHRACTLSASGCEQNSILLITGIQLQRTVFHVQNLAAPSKACPARRG